MLVVSEMKLSRKYGLYCTKAYDNHVHLEFKPNSPNITRIAGGKVCNHGQ